MVCVHCFYSIKCIVLSVLTWFNRKSNKVLSSKFVQGSVPDESSVFSGDLETALQSNGISFGTVLLVKLSCFGYNGLGSCHIFINDL